VADPTHEPLDTAQKAPHVLLGQQTIRWEEAVTVNSVGAIGAGMASICQSLEQNRIFISDRLTALETKKTKPKSRKGTKE
jgi:hypothetical protein